MPQGANLVPARYDVCLAKSRRSAGNDSDLKVEADLEAHGALARIRGATRIAHAQLDDRLDAVARFADPSRRGELVDRFARLHLPVEAALGAFLADMPDLEYTARRRAGHFDEVRREPPPSFPVPASRAEALGLLYVVEGSALGGRMILRMLAERGVHDPALRFLDPYGERTGALWRGFLAVLARETVSGERAEAAVRGACRGFAHAEQVLCGAAA